MVALRIDRRMTARVDPSDVVQEALADAAGSLSDYLKNRPLPFYPWLRQFAWERLLQLHRHHLQAKRRSVTREQLRIFDLAGDSEAVLVTRRGAKGLWTESPRAAESRAAWSRFSCSLHG
jgi:RNA polymerase sigma-70 factor (ECF subfamily)